MDADRFDSLTRTLTVSRSRRVTLRGLAAGVLLSLGPALDESTVLGQKKDCPKSKPNRCGNKCCKTSQACKKGKCINHCNDKKKNFGETDKNCGGTCRDIRKCQFAERCETDADCFNNVCTLAFTPPVRACVECREDSDCLRFGPPSFRCFDNVCFDCSRDADCPRPGQREEQDKCIEPVDGECPAGKPCVCRQCRITADCPQDKFCDETGTCIDCVSAQGQGGQVRAADCIENTCGADQDFCQDGIAGCNGNPNCRCRQTIGNQPFCSGGDQAICGCTGAADCTILGPGAECVRINIGPCADSSACQTICAEACA